MKNVTVRSLKFVVPERMKIMRTGTDGSVDHTAQVDTMNAGRLAVHNELVRFKYCT